MSNLDTLKEMLADARQVVATYGDDGDDARFKELAQEDVAALESAISSMERDQWIAVKDKLPGKSDLYIIYAHNWTFSAYKQEAHQIFFTTTRYFDFEKLDWRRSRKEIITHWLPLPTPPIDTKGE